MLPLRQISRYYITYEPINQANKSVISTVDISKC